MKRLDADLYQKTLQMNLNQKDRTNPTIMTF